MMIARPWQELVCVFSLSAVLLCGCDAPAARSPASGEQAASAKLADIQKPGAGITPADRKKSTAVAKPGDTPLTQWELNPPRWAAPVKDSTPPVPPGTNPLFTRYCTVCHGPEGRGDGQYYSDALAARPANLTDSQAMGPISDDQIATIINAGTVAVGKSPLCPPWGRVFSKEQVADLVVFVRGLSAAQPSNEN
jgi:hypothetical protein